MAFSRKFNPWAKALQWVLSSATTAWGDITGKPSWVAGTEESFTTTLKNKLDSIVDPLIYKGVINCSGNPNYPAASTGHVYKVSVAGKIGGASGPNVEVGDGLICNADSVAGNHATVGSYWNIIQVNVDGAVTGPASSTDSNIAEFDSTSGKIIKDGSLTHANVNDAISEKHIQGTDQGLDTGGANAVTAAQAKTAYSHSQVSHAPSDAVSLTTVKADSDVSDALSKRHTQNTDQYLDFGGASQVSALQVKSAVTDDHTHSNKTTLDNTQESFTTTLKNKLDGIEASADVTDSTNVDGAGATMNADTSLVGNGYFLDEDTMTSNSDTKIPSQQSVKAYVDSQVGTKIGNVVDDTTPELGGEMDCGLHSIGFTEQAITSTSNEATVNWKLSNKAKLTLSENVTTFNFTAPSNPCNLLLRVIQDASPRTIAWPASVKWAAGTAPTLTTTAGRIDIITFYYDGTYYYGSYIQNFNIA